MKKLVLVALGAMVVSSVVFGADMAMEKKDGMMEPKKEMSSDMKKDDMAMKKSDSMKKDDMSMKKGDSMKKDDMSMKEMKDDTKKGM
ncbi:hypothetical protein [uncultured Campylobacter sp.]|uniref:hypothetical protein n=1 Tax=uncultured Campylobacter sp. TaxID=218934 RepID=UPI0025E04487|nr:hypothetical protein [uncultured Campylobacter sp.]